MPGRRAYIAVGFFQGAQNNISVDLFEWNTFIGNFEVSGIQVNSNDLSGIIHTGVWPGLLRINSKVVSFDPFLRLNQNSSLDGVFQLTDIAWPNARVNDTPKVITVDLNSINFEIPDEGIPLEEIERNIILNALEKANGNISKAARLLRINRGKFRYRLERLGLSV